MIDTSVPCRTEYATKILMDAFWEWKLSGKPMREKKPLPPVRVTSANFPLPAYMLESPRKA